MSRKRHSAEEIVNKLRQADVELGRGRPVLEVCRLLGVTEPTYYRVWMAPGRAAAEQSLDLFVETYNAKYPKAVFLT